MPRPPRCSVLPNRFFKPPSPTEDWTVPLRVDMALFLGPNLQRAAVTDASRFTFGGGMLLGRLQLDYAFQGYQALGGGTHRVGVRWTP